MLEQFIGFLIYYYHIILITMWNPCDIDEKAQYCSIDQYYHIQLNPQSFTMSYLLVSCIAVVF